MPLKPSHDEDAVSTPGPVTNAQYPIVGVGASAGGLEAFTQFLRALPLDTGMAFVLVQHLSPTHESALAQILSRATRMPVMEVHDEPVIEPNHVYVIPPNRCMGIVDGVLQLAPREKAGHTRVVDHFFRALAEERRHLAIGIVLSGNASDGTLGLEAIKAEGGITFAQDDSAQYNGMPHSAIASGCVDLVMSPEQIAHEVVRIARHPCAVPEESGTSERDRKPQLARVLQLLHRATGVDFSQYKFNTLYRRVTRRMVLQKQNDLNAYADLLQQNPDEITALYRDILINVTRFFRNPDAFEALKEQVFPRLLESRTRHEPVRIWTLGCSTGQEAYSVAMAFTEVAEALGSAVPLQIFASDLSEACVDTARQGIYSKDIAQDVSPERLRRFFVDVDGRYRITRAIRDTCVFSRHNVLTDPPFSRLDLVTCRNLLIYMEPVLQQKVVPTLHYALKPSGFLWLGTSETIGGFRNLFEPLDARQKIYARNPSTRGTHQALQNSAAPRAAFVPIASRTGVPTAPDLHREADRLLLTRFAPPSVLISPDLDILQYRGDTSPYLSPSPGKASLHLPKMLREGLLVGVRAALLRVVNEGKPAREEGLRVKSHDGWRNVAVEVVPLHDGNIESRGYLVLFDEPDGPLPVGGGPPGSDGSAPATHAVDADLGNLALSRELAATRDYLQSVIEQQEAANEELQSSNEEIQSANEELQSVNEELETSKEEIQSSNEELTTVNDELNSRNAELNRLNNDLVNVFASVQTPIVLIGADMRVRRFTPAAEKLFDLMPEDIGRPMSRIRSGKIDLPDLEPLLSEVLDTVNNREIEVRDRSGSRYLVRLRPYRTLDNRIDGVVLMLVDIESLKRAHERTENVIATVREPMLLLDGDLRVQMASRSFYRHFGVNRDETDGRLVFELGDGQWNIVELRQLLEQVLARGSEFNDYEVQHDFVHLGPRTMLLNARRLLQLEEHDQTMILLAIEDITERKAVQDAAAQLATSLAEADRRKNEFLAMLAHEMRNPLGPIRNALQIMQRVGGQGEVTQTAIEVMERQVGQMVRLVDDLLDVNRISRGKIELRSEPIDLATIVQQAVESARPVCENKGVELTVVLPSEPVVLNADPIRLVQALGNLLHNACKFTHKGGGTWIEIEPDGAEVVIRVRDNGIGIAAEQLPHIFNMFMQVDTSLERSNSGLGIGLSLVRSLVELHGGTVQATSAGKDQGSEFMVRLPIVAGLTVAAEPPCVVDTGAFVSRRILVVDDNQDGAESLSQLLQLSGHETRLAHDGLGAVEMAATFRPELVLLDIGLPKMNGYEAAQKMREQPGGGEMTLVALTGWGYRDDRQKSMQAGFDKHLVKPVHPDVLLQLIEDLPRRGDGLSR